MDQLYRVVVEAVPIAVGSRLGCGFNPVWLPQNEGDWIGGVYVFAASNEAAIERISNFLSTEAVSWSFEGPLEILKSETNYALDHDAIVGSGELAKLRGGHVVAGFGL